MKVVILAGGFGTRLSEETQFRPKPMVEIGGKPILWHIMKIYAAFGFRDFVICLGYKGALIKDYFLNYHYLQSDITVEPAKGAVTCHQKEVEDWRVTLVDTGLETQTGGRLLRAASYLEGQPFMMTYGDGVANVDIGKLVAFHQQHGLLATVTAGHAPGRFGALTLGETDRVEQFREKVVSEGAWVNAGFFVLDPKVLSYIGGDQEPFEFKPLTALAKDRQLAAFRHPGFWQPMDTLREKNQLETLWRGDHPPWKVWS
ncbi:glucose-1-phosphate cytidylyltransferase [Acanthopleuribacter pedis]|uniref:Glucose-1-phosphate cytidylyltransferase n=1 Tax=Acanthopleuribacter pedis TaxID=442870 RepID=A0A8J7Q4Q2_9BACT|nr:glucose-1-phosphate cytidylyltransferase [Acanthopleuribacter pedis]MBO1318042.1 glucose-1-phosphate cytidylyltransferase [Acanthopleuribacter pedis]